MVDERGQLPAAIKSISQFIYEQLQTSQRPVEDIEIELRFGVIDGASFRPGIRRTLFDFLCDIFAQQEDKYERRDTHTVEYIYPPPADGDGVAAGTGDIRITYDTKEKVCVKKEMKKRHASKDVRTAKECGNDVRVATATEQLLLPVPDDLPPGHLAVRDKHRFTFVPLLPRGSDGQPTPAMWRVDLTLVKSAASDGSPPTVSYELEFEFDKQFNHALVDRAVAQRELTAMFALVQRVMMAMADAGGFPDVAMDRVADPDEIAALRRRVNHFLPDLSDDHDRFPGPMPVAFSRRHIPAVQAGAYMVSEKSDGIRYMMLLYEASLYLIDRDFQFYYVAGFDELCDRVNRSGAPQAPTATVLDGELVRHRDTHRPVFMLFDAVAVDSRSFATEPLARRLEAIRDLVVLPYRDYVGDMHAGGESALPFSLIGKSFFPKDALPFLFREHIRDAKDGGARVYRDKRRHHKTDGIIVTPAQCGFRPPPDAPILKWKYPDLLSVDFQLLWNEERRQWYFACGGERGEPTACLPVALSDDDMARLAGDMSRGDVRCMILECTYDRHHGRWKYDKMRPDKTKPNHITTVFDTLQVVAEDVSREELLSRLSVPPEHDRWMQHEADARARYAAHFLAPKKKKKRPDDAADEQRRKEPKTH